MSAFLKILSSNFNKPPPGLVKPSIRDAKAVQDHISSLIIRFLNKETISDFAPEVEALVHSAAVHDVVWDVVVAVKEDSARNLLDILQMWLDQVPASHALHNNAIYIIVKLASISGEFPLSLRLNDVEILKMAPTFGGGGGDIYIGQYQGKKCAIKKPRFSSAAEKQDWLNVFVREALIWRQLKHPNILPFYGIDDHLFESENVSTLVMPWMELGSLDDFVRNPGYNPKLHRNRLLYEVASGLQYLHSLKITHGDIKGGNVLITSETHAVLSDFGLVVVGQTTQHRPTTMNGQYGTIDFSAPELLLGQISRSNPPVDVYAFACLCRQMWSRDFRVWIGMSQPQIQKAITQGYRPPRPSPEESIGKPMSDQMWYIVEKCWGDIPERRFKIEDVVAFFERDGPVEGTTFYYAAKATAVENYTARPGTKDVTVYEGESLRVIAPITGWHKVATSTGKIGFLPNHIVSDLTLFTVVARANYQATPRTSTNRPPSDDKPRSFEPQLSFNEGDELRILCIIGGEYWWAQDSEGNTGFVPSHQLDIQPAWKKSGAPRVDMRVIYDHSQPVTHSLRLKRGAIVAVKRMNGAWTLAVTNASELGVVRTTYLKPIPVDT